MQDQILTPWMYRRWQFDSPSELYPAVIERLRGLPARAEELAGSVGREELVRTPEEGWSVIRHLSHLADLEQLLTQRLDAYERGVHELPAADMSNQRTVASDPEHTPTESVLSRIRSNRESSVARLEQYPREFFARSAWHDRLSIQKRVVDTCQFFADHDDHHLALARFVIESGSLKR